MYLFKTNNKTTFILKNNKTDKIIAFKIVYIKLRIYTNLKLFSKIIDKTIKILLQF